MDVHIPHQLREFTNGAEVIQANATTLGELIKILEVRFPGLRGRLESDGRLAAWLSVVVDGELSPKGIFTEIADAKEIQFLPAISGG